MTNWFMNLFMDIFFNSEISHWIWSIVMGVTDVIDLFIDRLTGLGRAPAYFNSWQNLPLPKFPLPYLPHDLPIKTSKWDICGEYLVTLLFSYIPASEVQSTLTGGLRLDPANIRADGTHPVIYLFGYTEDMHRVWNPLRGPSYLEYGVCVPNVYITGDEGYLGPFLYLPVLHLNRLYPTVLGRLAGYRKFLSRIATTENSYEIKTLLTDTPLVSATFEPTGPVEVGHCQKNMERWEQLLGQPNANPYLWGQTLFLHYHWGWEFSQIQAVNANVTVHRDMPAFPKGTYHWKGIGTESFVTTDQVPEGAFRCSIPFELLPPFSRSKLISMTRKPVVAPKKSEPVTAPAAAAKPQA
jgi:hypothetical protein